MNNVEAIDPKEHARVLAELAEARNDVLMAADALMVNIDDAPPGSLVARLVIANRMLVSQRDEARREQSIPDDATRTAYEALQGRLGRDDDTKAETVVHACEQYVLAEDELTDEFDSEDYSLSKAVGAMRCALEEERERVIVLEFSLRSSRGQEECALLGVARYARLADVAKAFVDAQVGQLGDHSSERTDEENALHREVKRLADASIVVARATTATRERG